MPSNYDLRAQTFAKILIEQLSEEQFLIAAREAIMYAWENSIELHSFLRGNTLECYLFKSILCRYSHDDGLWDQFMNFLLVTGDISQLRNMIMGEKGPKNLYTQMLFSDINELRKEVKNRLSLDSIANDSRKWRTKSASRSPISLSLKGISSTVYPRPLTSTATIDKASSMGTAASTIRIIPRFSPKASPNALPKQIATSSTRWCWSLAVAETFMSNNPC